MEIAPSTQSAHHRLNEGEALVGDLADVSLAGPSGVVWALASPQLNVNLVTIRAGESIEEHVNAEVDVLMLTESGSGHVVIDGVQSALGPASVVLVPQGSRRSVSSATGITYYSIHQRRAGLVVQG